MPSYACWEMPFFGTGLMMYDALAGRRGLGKTSFLGKDGTLRCLPNLKPTNLRGGVKYWDGQFDDARLALARTAAQQGALLINYMPVTGLLKENGKISGVHCQDALTGENFSVRARCVVNATGVWVDRVRQMASAPDSSGTIKDMVSPSQGVHIVVDRSFMPGNHALIIPKTSDGRVLFAVPWLGKVILGTTDTPRHDTSEEPDAFKEELEFILNESARYLERAPSRQDIRSIWVGLRPLVKPVSDDGTATKKISREHTVMISREGLVTVTGGKWTTYRAMAEDVMQHCQATGLVTTKAKDQTEHTKLVGSQSDDQTMQDMTQPPGEHSYGDERHILTKLPGHHHVIAEGLTEAMVRFAARFEYAVHVEDVLARRSRLLLLDAHEAESVADDVGRILKEETGLTPEVDAFKSLAKHYQRLPE
jgi:glycerol-3-phosphate dehydrogenase